MMQYILKKLHIYLFSLVFGFVSAFGLEVAGLAFTAGFDLTSDFGFAIFAAAGFTSAFGLA
ncbi:MAG: hypothetical protein LBU84_09990, partial [Prevotella sp.]|nr:hypothetical protein [Prevotella sp.]